MDASAPVIRPSTPADVPGMIAVTAEVFGPVSMDRHAENMLGPAVAPWIEIKGHIIAAEVAANPAGCFVAEMDGQVAGYVTTLTNAVARRGTIANLAVSGRAQGKGLGRGLILRALDHFRSLGLVQARIDTLECNEVGKHLYPAVGFKEVVREIHYFMSLSAPPQEPGPSTR
jgi:ribosomal protein S18 acetylase RimI-like enzyme